MYKAGLNQIKLQTRIVGNAAIIDGFRGTFVRRIATCQSNSAVGDAVCRIVSWAEVYTIERCIAPQHRLHSDMYQWCLRYHTV